MWAFVVVVLVQAPVVKVAAPAFSLVGIEPKLGAAFQDRFVSRLGSAQVRVTSQRDIEQVLGLERQKALLGCDTESSTCLSELAGALGVDLVLSASVARSESGFIATIRVIRAENGQLVAAPNTRVATEAQLLDWLDQTADSLRDTMLGKPVATSGPPSKVVPWVPAMVGGALAIAGAVILGLARYDYDWLNAKQPNLFDPTKGTPAQVLQEGVRFTTVGTLLAGFGAAAIVASIIWSTVSSSSPKVAFMPSATGGTLAIVGVWP
jgi:hypothetical protein